MLDIEWFNPDFWFVSIGSGIHWLLSYGLHFLPSNLVDAVRCLVAFAFSIFFAVAIYFGATESWLPKMCIPLYSHWRQLFGKHFLRFLELLFSLIMIQAFFQTSRHYIFSHLGLHLTPGELDPSTLSYFYYLVPCAFYAFIRYLVLFSSSRMARIHLHLTMASIILFWSIKASLRMINHSGPIEPLFEHAHDISYYLYDVALVIFYAVITVSVIELLLFWVSKRKPFNICRMNEVRVTDFNEEMPVRLEQLISKDDINDAIRNCIESTLPGEVLIVTRTYTTPAVNSPQLLVALNNGHRVTIVGLPPRQAYAELLKNFDKKMKHEDSVRRANAIFFALQRLEDAGASFYEAAWDHDKISVTLKTSHGVVTRIPTARHPHSYITYASNSTYVIGRLKRYAELLIETGLSFSPNGLLTWTSTP